jgi:DNA-binding beta-propeller fold protein YncE
MLQRRNHFVRPSLIGMLLIAALATFALVGSAAALGSTPTWYVEGEELTGEEELQLHGELEFHLGGGTVIYCSISGEGTIYNEEGAKGAVSGASIEEGKCQTNLGSCTASEALVYGFWEPAGFGSGNTFEIKQAYFTANFVGSCSSLSGKKTWHGNLVGEWDDSTGCVTYEGPNNIFTVVPGWTWSAAGELCFTAAEGKELRINPPAVPSFKFAFGSEGSGNGQLQYPYGVAVDSGGNTWVADSGNARIQKFNSKGEYVSQFGSYGTGNGQFTEPVGIAFDASGNLLVLDSAANRIQKFNSKGEYLSQFGSEGAGSGQFFGAYGITVDSAGNIWVADSGNSRIQKFDSKGKYLGGIGSWGSGKGQFSNPYGIAVDSAGNFWVSDADNNRIQEFNPSGIYVTQIGSYGTGNGQLSQPFGITVDSAGNLWVADGGNNRIQKFDSKGKYLSQFGSTGTGTGQFQYSAAITADAAGGIWVSDLENHRVQKWAP